MAIGDVTWRQRVEVTGRIKSLRIQPWAGVATLEAVVSDGTGNISVVFLGRRRIPGIHPGTRLSLRGLVGRHRESLAILNPDYELLPPA
jgi:RecG-like helicase